MSSLQILTPIIGLAISVGGFIHKEFILMGTGLAMIMFSIYMFFEERRNLNQKRGEKWEHT